MLFAWAHGRQRLQDLIWSQANLLQLQISTQPTSYGSSKMHDNALHAHELRRTLCRLHESLHFIKLARLCKLFANTQVRRALYNISIPLITSASPCLQIA